MKGAKIDNMNTQATDLANALALNGLTKKLTSAAKLKEEVEKRSHTSCLVYTLPEALVKAKGEADETVDPIVEGTAQMGMILPRSLSLVSVTRDEGEYIVALTAPVLLEPETGKIMTVEAMKEMVRGIVGDDWTEEEVQDVIEKLADGYKMQHSEQEEE